MRFFSVAYGDNVHGAVAHANRMGWADILANGRADIQFIAATPTMTTIVIWAEDDFDPSKPLIDRRR